MDTPKLLPWYASQAGITIEQAAALWQQAIQKTNEEENLIGSPSYWNNASSNFLRLLDVEKAANYTSNLTQIMRNQTRLMRLPLIAIDDVFTAMSSSWKRQQDEKAREAA